LGQIVAGVNNTAIGSEAMRLSTAGVGNTAVGVEALTATEGDYNIGVGYKALGGASATYDNSTAIGYQAGLQLTSGADNLLFGYNSGYGLTTGSNNIVFATNLNLDSGDNNILIGAEAFSANVSSDGNTGVGYQPARFQTGQYNVAIGQQALYGNSGASAGADNVAVGVLAGFEAEGARNTYLGRDAGKNHTNNDSVFIGYRAGWDQTTAGDLLIIDNQDRVSAAGELTDALIVGNFHATPSSQRLLVNADLVTSGSYNFAADAEASDTYVITLDPVPNGYRTGMQITFTANTATDGDATLNVNGLGAKAILKMHDQALVSGDIEAGQVVQVVYDGTQFQMTSQLAQ